MGTQIAFLSIIMPLYFQLTNYYFEKQKASMKFASIQESNNE